MDEPSIRILSIADVDAFVAHVVRHVAENGVDGNVVFSPFEPGAARPRDNIRANTIEGWAKELDEAGWRRTFGLVVGDTVRGHAEVRGRSLKSERHRVDVSLGLEGPYRRHGHGRALMERALAFAREAAHARYADLGVFAHNHAAHALYCSLGFVEVGTVRERFIVSGEPIDDITMVKDLRT